MKKALLLKKCMVLICLSALLTSEAFAASKKKKAAKEAVSKEAEAAAESTSEQTNFPDSDSIKLPSVGSKRTYFYKIPSEILLDVENGSPDSLRNAMTKIRKNESEYTENEKVLIAVAADIMKIAWQSERITWNVYPVAEENPYTGAINSARNGVYDSSTGNVDFLTILLPSLVLLTNKNISADDALQSRLAILKALSLNEDSVLANYLAGVLFEYQKDYIKAEPYFEKAFKNSSQTLELGLAYARILNQNEKSDEAMGILARFSAVDAGNILLLKQSAYIAFSQKNYTLAEDYVARVLQQTPNDLEFLLFRAKIFIEKNDYIHAVTLLDMYARQNDTNLDYLILRARVQLDWSKNTDSATKTIEKALQLYPDDEDALMIAARISSATDAPVAGKYADELASKVLSKNPENQNALVYALDGLMQRENWQEAYEISRKIAASENISADAVSRHVKICLKLKKKTEAMEVARAAYEKNPSDDVIVQSYILAYSEVESRESALSLINSMLDSTSSKNIKSYLFYQRSFFQRTDDAVLADLRSSLIANSRNSDALFRLYEIYFARSDYKKAQYYLKQVVSIKPNDSSVKKLNEALTQLMN